MEQKRFEEMTEEERAESLKEINRATAELFESAFKGLPLWASAGYLYNISRGKDDENIDWARVNILLNNNKSKYDFNAFDEVTSCEDLRNLVVRVNESSILDGPWQRVTCKVCGKRFTLSHDEVMFFRDHGLEVPKRCLVCRGKIKSSPEPVKKEIGTEVYHPTAMEVAMKKVGLHNNLF